MAISAVGEGCEKQMTPILGEVVAAVLPFCQDQVRREGEWRKGEWGRGGEWGGRSLPAFKDEQSDCVRWI